MGWHEARRLHELERADWHEAMRLKDVRISELEEVASRSVGGGADSQQSSATIAELQDLLERERWTTSELKRQLASEADESRHMQARLKELEEQVAALAAAIPVATSLGPVATTTSSANGVNNMAAGRSPAASPPMSRSPSTRFDDPIDTAQAAVAEVATVTLERRLRRASEESASSGRITSKLLLSLRDMHRELQSQDADLKAIRSQLAAGN